VVQYLENMESWDFPFDLKTQHIYITFKIPHDQLKSNFQEATRYVNISIDK